MAQMGRIRFALAAIGLAGAGAIAAATSAFACTNLATLSLSHDTGMAGSQVMVSGSAFGATAPVAGAVRPAGAAGGAGAPVVVHWGSADGPVLIQLAPSADGHVGPATVTIPADAAPGVYTVVATEVDATGRAAYGTPSRAPFTVIAPDRSGLVPSGAPANAGPAPVPGGGTSTGLLALTVALGVFGVGLFGASAALVIRHRRRAFHVPDTVPTWWT